jgi:hypothetical protein
MIFESQAELAARIEELTGRPSRGRVVVFEDTSNYMAIYGGTVLRLAGRDYLVMGDTHEGRFGIDEQPKFWVKRCADLETGARKIVKFVFEEQFTSRIRGIAVRHHRSPRKESAFLDFVRGDPRFMQGVTVEGSAGEPIRVIDLIAGRSLYAHLYALETDHETYFFTELPRLMPEVVEAVAAIARVHHAGLHHGDLRNDHILIEAATGRYTWIDFDYQVNFADYDVWSMGNILSFVVGKGIHTFHDVRAHPELFPARREALEEDDGMLLFPGRVANLAKLFPYIPRPLNDVLMRFSHGAADPYTDLDQQVADLRALFGGGR